MSRYPFRRATAPWAGPCALAMLVNSAVRGNGFIIFYPKMALPDGALG